MTFIETIIEKFEEVNPFKSNSNHEYDNIRKEILDYKGSGVDIYEINDLFVEFNKLPNITKFSQIEYYICRLEDILS